MSGGTAEHLSDNARTITVFSGMVRTSDTVSRSWILRQTERHPEVTGSTEGIMVRGRYLGPGFPSLVPSAGYHRVDSSFDSVERILASEIRKILGVEQLFIRKDRDFYRIWAVLNEPDVAIEDKVYEAQLRFMDQLDLPCDFSVIFRQGKDPASVRPAGAHRLYG